jgi:hypothetical protein
LIVPPQEKALLLHIYGDDQFHGVDDFHSRVQSSFVMPDLIRHPERLTHWNKNGFRRLPRTRSGVRRNDGVEFTPLIISIHYENFGLWRFSLLAGN